MTNRSRSLVACALAMSGLLAVACDETTPGTDAGPNPEDGGPGIDGGPGTDSGSTPDTDGGPTPSDCDADAAAYCDRFQECNETGFLAAYETNAICRRVVAAGCEAGGDPIPLTNGVTDEDACLASQVSSCEGFLGASAAPIPAACVPAPGDVTTPMGNCALDAQCGVGTITGGTMAGMMRQMYCRGLDSGGTRVFGTPECPRGECIFATALGSSCTPGSQTAFCDRYAGQECAKQFEDTGAGVTGADQCRQIQYGTAGAMCAPGSDRQCASGFKCDPMPRRCMAVLNEGQTCIPGARDLCDSRLGLSCQDLGDGDVCAGPVYVRVGAQCGAVTEGGRTTTRLCSAYARCDTTVTPNVCVALRALDETCTQSPDNCEPGLECDDDTDVCVVPEPGSTTCP